MNFISKRYVLKTNNFPNKSCSKGGAATMSSSKSDFYIVVSKGGNMQRLKLTTTKGFRFWICNILNAMLGRRDAMCWWDCWFLELSVQWLLLGPEVPWHICNQPATIAWITISYPNVLGTGAAASSSVCNSINPITSIQSSCTCYLSEGTDVPHPHTQVASIHQRSSASVRTLLALHDHFGDYAHHPTGIVLTAQLAQLGIFIVTLLLFPILLIGESCNTA